MKRILLIAFAAVISLGSFAQTTIVNGTLESWQNVGANTEEPTQWNSTKSAGGTYSLGITFAPQTLWRETSNPHSGSYCARIVTGNALGTIVNGAFTTGQVTINSATKSEGFIQTVTTNANHNMPFIGRPDSIVFWYRYTPQGSDYPRLEARLHVGNCQAPEIPVNNNHPLDTPNIVARALWQGTNTTVSTWTRVSIPFTYRNGNTPQYILVTSTSSGDQLGGSANSTLWLDDIEAIYNPTIAVGTIAPTTYYVSATSGATVSVPYTLTGTFTGSNTVTAQLSDASGSFASPTNIGSVTSTASGTVTATIPANTTSGTGYRIRVVSSTPTLTSANNSSDITINLVNNSVTPGTIQLIEKNTNGTALTVTESAGAVSREWKYATVSGGPYVSFVPAQTGTTYTPNFALPRDYFMVCVTTYPNSLTVSSNEVQVSVVGNSIAPASPQSLLVGVNGTQLTVTEVPTGMWREWKYATVSGGPYLPFTPAITGATAYTPNFANAGTYYVICYSEISGIFVTSNEVIISVGNATLATGTITGSPFQFSATAPDAAVTVPYTTSGTFNGGNTFTAQLSDASGSFSNPSDIGTVLATSSGTIAATIPATTPAGTGYRIRVIADNPSVLGSDNGTDLVVDQFNNSISPSSTQTILHGTNGTAITVTASQPSTQEWKYSTTSGGTYLSFNPVQSAATYTPNFATPGTYYVVASSLNIHADAVISNEVQINVTNGTTITTLAVSGSPFLVSATMPASVSVDFTSNVVFDANNVFKAQLSDNNGSFANPVEIGTLTDDTVGTISALIPSSSVAGTGYRIRVVSTSPAVTGSDNGTDLEVIPFEISIAPTDTQFLLQNENGNAISVTETHIATRVWKYSQVSGLGYVNFNPSETGTSVVPHFNLVGPYYVICESTNGGSDKVTSQEVVVIVTAPNSINESEQASIKAFWSGNDFVVDLSAANLNAPVLELLNVSGQVVVQENLSSSLNRIHTDLPEGIYVFRIADSEKSFTGKLQKK